MIINIFLGLIFLNILLCLNYQYFAKKLKIFDAFCYETQRLFLNQTKIQSPDEKIQWSKGQTIKRSKGQDIKRSKDQVIVCIMANHL